MNDQNKNGLAAGQKRSGLNSKSIAMLGMMSALAFIAKLISTIFPMVSGFLSFDLKDVIIVITGFISGPLAAVFVTVVVSFIEMITISSTGIIGFVMNVLQSCAFACTAAVIYRRNRTLKGAIIGLICGTLLMTAVMLLWNWLITPLYMKVPRSVVVGMLAPVFLPFNLVKGGINATLAVLLYKPVVTTLIRAKLIETKADGSGKTTKWGLVGISVVLLATFVLLALVLAGKI